jgi:hypothetical protein
MPDLTGFFNDEKKLGSYLARFAALLISLSYIYANKEKISKIILNIISHYIFSYILFIRKNGFILWNNNQYFLFFISQGQKHN